MQTAEYIRVRAHLFKHTINKLPVTEGPKLSARDFLKAGHWPASLGNEHEAIQKHAAYLRQTLKYHTSGGKYDSITLEANDILDNSQPLSFVEQTSLSSWFAMHPEKVAGVAEETTSLHFPVAIKGTKEDIVRVIKEGIKLTAPQQTDRKKRMLMLKLKAKAIKVKLNLN